MIIHFTLDGSVIISEIAIIEVLILSIYFGRNVQRILILTKTLGKSAITRFCILLASCIEFMWFCSSCHIAFWMCGTKRFVGPIEIA